MVLEPGQEGHATLGPSFALIYVQKDPMHTPFLDR